MSEQETFPDYRKSVEATTLEQAIKAASEFTKKVTFAEYAQALSEVYEQVMDDEDITDEV